MNNHFDDDHCSDPSDNIGLIFSKYHICFTKVTPFPYIKAKENV